MPKFLVDGAELKCPMGTSSGSLKVSAAGVKGCGKPLANTFDCIPMVNITPFGTCKITKCPCIPATTPWNSSSNVKIRGAPALNEKNCTMCALGGKISSTSAGQSKIRNSSGGASAAAAVSAAASTIAATTSSLELEEASNKKTKTANASDSPSKKPAGKEKFNKRLQQKEMREKNSAKGGTQYKGTPGNNQAQNRQAKSARKAILGNKPPSKHGQKQYHKNRRRFHEEISRENEDYDGLIDSARYIKGE